MRGSFFVTCARMGAFTAFVWRWIVAAWLTPLGARIARLWQHTAVRLWRRIRREAARIRGGFPLARERLAAAWKRGWYVAVLQVLLLPVQALRRHRRSLGVLAQASMVLASALVLYGVVRYWRGTTFALELIYDNKSVGYITDESVYKEALGMAESRIIRTDETYYAIEREAYMTLRPVNESRVITETQLCDELLRCSGGEVEQMSGLYIDGAFEGALATRQEMQNLLDDILSAYDTDATVFKTAEFGVKVEIIDGLYPVGAKEAQDKLFARLTARDEDGLPYLPVHLRCTEVYTEPISFARTTVQDTTKYIGYTAVATEGVEGERRITAEVVYQNGVELYREVVDEQVTREPVDEVTVQGAYRVNANAQAGVATGRFMWPVPNCHTVWSPFGYRWGKLHAGIDISGPNINGQTILASDGGTVCQINTEGWGGGYGLFVMIDHGNGYATMYGHCSEVLVKEGQKVTQGEMIAKVGSTGDSSGPHLHFEIRVRGVATDPVPYIN